MNNSLTRLFYCESSEMDSLIENGIANAWDIIITSDNYNHKLYLLTDELRQIMIAKSKTGVKAFSSMREAESFLLNSLEIQEGEIVCVLQNDRYVPYIVYVNLDGDYYLRTFVTEDYNVLIGKPTIEGIEVSGDKTFADYGLRKISRAELETLLV